MGLKENTHTSVTENPHKKLYIETYGCQMNVADSEVVASIMQMDGFVLTEDFSEADAVLINTCSIRDNAEQRVFERLKYFHSLKRKNKQLILGVIGCMAERMKEELIEKQGVDLVAGPDAYLDLPNLMGAVEKGEKAINIQLSRTETYQEVIPARLGGQISGFISITRGCDNFCSYCIVPYTRGRERSRDVESILNELKDLQQKNFKEVTLLGQNVNSYRVEQDGKLIGFPELLEIVAQAAPEMRFRFTTSHPKDMSDRTLETIARYPNLCRFIHLPVQSGSNKILRLMNRKYTREWYLERIAAIRRILPDAAIGTDIFCGFHDETEEDHKQTLSLMREVAFDMAFTFKYSERPGTYAARHLPDNVSEEVKLRRLNEIIALQNELSLESNLRDVGKTFQVLVEGYSKRSKEQFFGRTSQNKVVIFPRQGRRIGETVKVKINSASSATLFGEVEHL
ncbi:MAG TPA: tRNA (N6-isopentenyl adenosine(37)-C2)-methylthiotransferase MiaB [Paludibacteraceae bacterium]|jgi:tRNA-2-methylthio-N6-dimethylallyladenosine synthase|nr:tRNA (N6-isopentenyl adenosine(37)-C2)-methylthiotransferase MiaB [Paludibacteraceae bacterium]OPZ02702.1 MAG: (Dimethylallyl)adenosine tRNA methylthiotransferase MiaB [Bacteroidetes bacterium ADurb.BinA395]HON02367.1 tRNA (N6-isopentenyl adenosine(37)-C2)-methylthiotransferase MiaB [Paludibacteraceae bacterium]HPD59550.1 tRNA (N6-isopentenyl adenosine(37)-C2)-methylthiotransferase MiaB [Paludibacteraceae bacterium]HPL76736.1 tRNA (N6-isopentenyl adenosine(37)-C2)-methylthiotransferase MiaB 